MRECAVTNRLVNNLTESGRKLSESGRKADPYYSVEFSIKDFDVQYQFKIRRIGSRSMCILVKEDSKILRQLKVGNIFTMKYRPMDAACPSDYFDTAITDMTKNKEGRFKGHYLVGLKIMCELSFAPEQNNRTHNLWIT